MNRRNARLRQEFRYQALLSYATQQNTDRREQLVQALSGTAQLPRDLYANAMSDLEKQRFDMYQDAITEYTSPKHPKILLTTSRDPSSRLKLFAKELRFIFANVQRVNRGQATIEELVASARGAAFTDLVIVHETRGRPDGLIISHLPYGPTAFFNIYDLKLRSEVEGAQNMPQKAPQLVFDNLESKIGRRINYVLKHLFETANEDSNRVISFVNRSDCVVFRYHVFERVGKEVLLKEIGPRFNLAPYRIYIDALDAKAPDVEWSLNIFSGASFKQQIL